MILLYSSQSHLVNTYRFAMALGGSARPFASQGSFEIAGVGDVQGGKNDMLQTLCLLPTSFMLHNLNLMSGAAREYVNRNIRFYQLFSLGMDLGLSHTLCATKVVASGRSNAEPTLYETVVAPTVKGAKSSKTKNSARIIHDSFIVPDGLEESHGDSDTLNLAVTGLVGPRSSDRGEIRDGFSMSLNARTLFETSYLQDESGRSRESILPGASRTMIEYFENLQRGFQSLRDDGPEGLTILYESFSSLPSFSVLSVTHIVLTLQVILLSPRMLTKRRRFSKSFLPS